jgi:[protein-PII] uridylyltransferase
VFKSIDEGAFKKVAGNSFATYFNTYKEDELKYQIKILMNQASDVSLQIRYSQKNNFDHVTIWSKKEKIGFAEICGKLSSASINIYSGRITFVKKNLALYTFEVSRFGKSTFRDRGLWRTMQLELEQEKLEFEKNKINKNISSDFKGPKVEAKIKIDNVSSKNFTIIEITSNDKPGLLYEISKNLKDEGLTVGLVKISTRRGSVDDSFYVKKVTGKKLTTVDDIQSVKESLKRVIS